MIDAGRKVLSFALRDTRADFHGSDLARDERGCQGFTLRSPVGSARIQLNLLGEHNVANALAACAAAHALGMPLVAMVEGLESLQPVKGRAVAQLAPNGVRVIDDSYLTSVKCNNNALPTCKKPKAIVNMLKILDSQKTIISRVLDCAFISILHDTPSNQTLIWTGSTIIVN